MGADLRRGVGRHRVILPVPAEAPGLAVFPTSSPAWERSYKTRAARRPVRIKLQCLQGLDHGEALVAGFWSRYGQSNYSGQTLLAAAKMLGQWAAFCRDTGAAIPGRSAVTDDLIRAFVGWLGRRMLRRRAIAAAASIVIECLAEAAELECPGQGELVRRRKSLVLASTARNGRRSEPGRALPDAQWQRLLMTARREAAEAMAGYRPGEVPLGGIDLVPFVILVGAYTGANPIPLLTMHRGGWRPEPVLDGYWRLTWRKDRAAGHEEQSLVFAGTAEGGMGVIELLDFVRRWTDPLVERTAQSCRNDLWLYQRETRRPAQSAAWAPKSFIFNHVLKWTRAHGLRVTLQELRTNAALTLLRSGRSLIHVQSFLQHRDLRTTWLYLRSEVLRPGFNRTIAAAQARIVGLVLPQPRTQAAEEVPAPKAVRAKLASGEWDLGTCACLDPYHSPVPGETSGRRCRSFHACYGCAHAVWFREHLPLEVWKLRRFEALRGRDPHWSEKYAATCEIIRRDILGSFSKADRDWAEREASAFAALPVFAASGVTV
jgi:hypothetical protein